ncbi:MAG: LacI family DNA-binding transcriptional regulator [Caldilineaceae bacterium]
MANIRDVASLSNVSPITVSRVLNNPERVSPATRARVEAAIEELGYIPNQIARSLRSSRTNTLALVLTDITNPFWTSVARSVEDAASAQGFNVILCNTDEDEKKQAEYLSVLLRRRVDGFLLVPARSEASAVESILRQKVPVVVLDRRVPGADVDVVRSDSEAGAYALTRHLIEQGHRQIAMLSGPLGVSTAQERVDGYRRALTEAGIPVDEHWIREGEYTVESGYAVASELLAETVLPSALLGANNFIALGAMRAIREAGLAVPENISVTCIDDIPAWLVGEPFLTVAAQSPYDLGGRATGLLLRQIREPGVHPAQEIVLPTELIVRHSTAAVNGNHTK